MTLLILELAYATYVLEYNSGHFETARMYADTALTIMKKIIPSQRKMVEYDHFLTFLNQDLISIFRSFDGIQ